MRGDLYEILEIEPNSTPDEIRKAYLRLAKTRHPDKGGDPAEFVELTKAYNVLSDPRLRERYDSAGSFSEEDAIMAQDRLLRYATELLVQVLDNIGEPTVDTKLIEIMRSICTNAVGMATDKLNRALQLSRSLRVSRRMIKRRGEGANLFALAITQKLDALEKEIDEMATLERDGFKVLEMLDNYESFADFVHAMQAGRYPSTRAQPSGGLGQFFQLSVT